MICYSSINSRAFNVYFRFKSPQNILFLNIHSKYFHNIDSAPFTCYPSPKIASGFTPNAASILKMFWFGEIIQPGKQIYWWFGNRKYCLCQQDSCYDWACQKTNRIFVWIEEFWRFRFQNFDDLFDNVAWYWYNNTRIWF